MIFGALLLGTQENWNAGQGKEEREKWRVFPAKEVQASSLELSVRLDHLGIAALEPSRMERLRLVGNSVRST